MRPRILETLVFLAFAAVMAHVTWWTFMERPPYESLKRVELETLRSPAGQHERNLYVRRNLHLPERPRFGWLRVTGPDVVELYVNGRLIDIANTELTSATVLTDLTPLLREGHNVIGAVCRQTSLDHRPELHIEGEYLLADGLHRIGVDHGWRCRSFFDRQHDYWYAIGFDDREWAACEVATSRLLSRHRGLDTAITTPSTGEWIAPSAAVTGAVLRHAFHTSSAVQAAWLRLQSAASYRVAVNDVVIATSEARLGTVLSGREGEQRIYDISALLQTGRNELRILLHTTSAAPQLAAEMEARLDDGSVLCVKSDADWTWRPWRGGDWFVDVARPDWQPCQVVYTADGRQPWEVARKTIPVALPYDIWLLRLFQRLALTLLIGTGIWLAIRFIERVGHAVPVDARRRRLSLFTLALVPATVLLIGAVLAELDPRVPGRWVYHFATPAAALALVGVQWAGLLMLGGTRWRSRHGTPGSLGLAAPARNGPRALCWLAVAAIVGVSGYLRYRDIIARPLSPDEVTMYRAAVNVWEYGFPSIVISENTPPVRASTSELVHFGGAMTSLFTDDDRLTVRLVPAMFGTLTTLLIFWVGRAMFGPWVGLAAAVMYALSPSCIWMANLGRYYSQLQFFALLVTYSFWRTLEPRGPLNRRALWCTVFAFICMYLSWEGSALLALPLMAAAAIERRDRVRSVLANPHVWAGMLVIGSVVLLQGAHRTLVQTARPLYGSGASDITLTPMWRYPGFNPWTYVPPSAWNRDLLLPLLALLASIPLLARYARRRPLRLLMVVLFGGTLIQALVLPVTATRYSYHFVPMFTLLAAVAVVSVGHGLSRGGRAEPFPLRGYARAVAAFMVIGFVVLSSGLVIDLGDLRAWRTSGKPLNAIRFPDQQATALYVRERRQPGDVVVVNAPHVMDHYLGRDSDYWLESQLHLQATLDDVRPLPLHRYKGAVMLRDVDHLRSVFAQHRRVWLITEPSFNARTNTSEVVEFIRANMDVVYEDFGSLVMLRDGSHRSAETHYRGEKTLDKGRSYLP